MSSGGFYLLNHKIMCLSTYSLLNVLYFLWTVLFYLKFCKVLIRKLFSINEIYILLFCLYFYYYRVWYISKIFEGYIMLGDYSRIVMLVYKAVVHDK